MSTYIGLSQIVERNAQVNGNHAATITDKVTCTWKEVRHHIACVAKCLGDNGVRQDDKIAILSVNSAMYLESLFIPSWMGAVCVPLNTRWSDPRKYLCH
ncbi:MAG: AMP-binding protein [Colwellia sp.]|nr:AMP-binding protein [Colwellia sp.]